MHTRRLAAASAGLALGVLLLTGAAPAARQAQAPGAKPAPAPSPAGQTPAPTGTPEQPFRVSIDLVTTDVIVRDDRDQFVATITKDDIEVYEDGVKQDLASMTLVHGGRVLNLQAPPPPPPQEGIILPTARPRNDAAGRIFLIIVDDLHLDFRNTGRIRDLFKRIARQLVHEGDMFGIVSTGPSSLAIDLTYDRKVLDEAIKKITGNGLKPSDIIQGQDNAQGPAEVRYRAQVAFSTVRDVVTQLERVNNRRKAVIWVSNGYDFNPFEKQRQGEDPIYGGRMGQTQEEGQQQNQLMNQSAQFADADLAREMAEITRSANRANATFYTIDPRGLVAGQDLDETVDPMDFQEYLRTTQDSLRVLAQETGGIAIVNQNNFDKGLKRIDAETSDYYVVGYYSSNPDPLKRTRKIEVKVKREGLNVWSRTSYTLRQPPSPTSK